MADPFPNPPQGETWLQKDPTFLERVAGFLADRLYGQTMQEQSRGDILPSTITAQLYGQPTKYVNKISSLLDLMRQKMPGIMKEADKWNIGVKAFPREVRTSGEMEGYPNWALDRGYKDMMRIAPSHLQAGQEREAIGTILHEILHPKVQNLYKSPRGIQKMIDLSWESPKEVPWNELATVAQHTRDYPGISAAEELATRLIEQRLMNRFFPR